MDKGLIAALAAMILIIGFQQLEISGLKDDHKILKADYRELAEKARTLEAQSEENLTGLQQINARIGYMDNKVENVIEENAQKTQQLQETRPLRANRPPTGESAESQAEQAEPDEAQQGHGEGNGIMDSLRRIFR